MCMTVCMCTRVHVQQRIVINTYMCIRICVCWSCVCRCLCVCTCVDGCLCIRMYVVVWVCACVCVCVPLPTPMPMRVCIYECIHVFACLCRVDHMSAKPNHEAASQTKRRPSPTKRRPFQTRSHPNPTKDRPFLPNSRSLVGFARKWAKTCAVERGNPNIEVLAALGCRRGDLAPDRPSLRRRVGREEKDLDDLSVVISGLPKRAAPLPGAHKFSSHFGWRRLGPADCTRCTGRLRGPGCSPAT